MILQQYSPSSFTPILPPSLDLSSPLLPSPFVDRRRRREGWMERKKTTQKRHVRVRG
jgi:hypothetical protein